MEEFRQQQFDLIEAAAAATKEWSKRNCIDLFRIEFIVPFLPTDFGLFVWCFYRLDDQLAAYAKDGTSKQLEQNFRETLKQIGYPESWRQEVQFGFDSDQNVQENFEGSYFYRLR